MSIFIILAILFAAFLHACWNFLVRSSDDKAFGMAGVIFGHVLLGVPIMLYVGLPPITSIWFIVASGFFHLLYQVFLLNAYRFGELTLVYPIARGVAPLIITLISVLFLSVALSPSSILGIGIICTTIIIHGFVQFRAHNSSLNSLWLALLAGIAIAAYSIIDGYGTRITGSAMSFYGASTVMNAILFIPYLMIAEKGVMSKLLTPAGIKLMVVGGAASYTAYIIILWAVLSAPIAVVSSLRETSVLFALLLGTVILKERLTMSKIVMTIAILSGVVVLRIL